MTIAGPILVTGGSGQVGAAVVRIAAARGMVCHAPGRAELDLADTAGLRAAVAGGKWRAVINCAAYTAVDAAEDDEAAAFALNAEAPAALAEACGRRAIPLVHVSTDYVFDGSKGGPYDENDPVAPLGAYGRSKAAGEEAVRALATRHAIVRTAWVLSAGPGNFLDTMLRLADCREEVSVVADQQGNPTGAQDLAKALLDVAANLEDRAGTWHCVNAGHTTWHGLAAHIFSRLEQSGRKRPILHPIQTAEFPTKARRPANSRLACDRIAADFGVSLRPWSEAVDALLEQRLRPLGRSSGWQARAKPPRG